MRTSLSWGARLRGIKEGLSDAWRLAKPYFRSEEKWIAWGLLAAIIALNLFMVYLNVIYTYWYKIAYNALEAKNEAQFFTSMFTYQFVKGYPWFVPGFIPFAAVNITVAVYAFYLNQMLEIRWRRWITNRFVREWLEKRAYYQISLTAQAGSVVDNPDQRIADDLRSFVSSNLSLGINFIANIVNLFSFVFVLWFIAPPLKFHGFTIPGWLVWTALIYSVVGTYFTNIIGRKLVPLNFQQQQVDADFRFNLVRVREHTEQIALYGGEDEEAEGLSHRFQAIYINWWRIMKRTKALNFFTIGFTQVAIIFPLIVAAPNYFAGIFTLGVLMQISNIFGNVQGSFSWFISSYPDLVVWRATVQRLEGFERAVLAAHAQTAHNPVSIEPGAAGLQIDGLALDLPDGRRLIEQDHMVIRPGEPLAITGPSGAGKSTLFRAIAGIWPFARGRIRRPGGRLMFLPQKPYFPTGSLKRAVAYPAHEHEVDDHRVRQALEDVGLAELADRLEQVDNWGLRLSGGEQQRLALARVLLVRPDWLFLDEALSALDEGAARDLFGMLRRRLPEAQIVSIAHHQALIGLHPRHTALVPGPAGSSRLAEAEAQGA
ncbi:MAG TPA: ABC transporter ATP-binding protein/permease [Acetobacteraceae bacterium]|nr:ABC transporter ATP-binding protein/permease [Acetobacteraceae bacterium]